ncbi:FRG domain-containing protein [Aeromonas sp. R2-1]|uniref:FRG domain-containing protein n=1 Tax=Aeromonas sp. R2-1 TaxID=3138459 RepID=UPI0034A509DE
MHRYIIKNIGEYVVKISEITEREDGNAWFRGHGLASYRLIPSVLRDIIPLSDSRGNSLRGDEPIISSGVTMTGIDPERLLSEFKRQAIHLINEKPRNDFEWLFLMQHYGVKTRLLDWTTNALVALYFALENEPQGMKPSKESNPSSDFISGTHMRDDGAAVYVMNPNKFNHESTEFDHPIDVANYYEHWKHYVRPTEDSRAMLPICIVAPHSSPRIRAQAGTFTLHGSMTQDIESYDPIDRILHKIFIPCKFISKMKKDLRALGMTKAFIYQDLDSLSEDIMKNEKRIYQSVRHKYLNSLKGK